MKTRDFAAKYIRFDKTTPVTGPFRLPMYRFLGAPMDASDDIRVKRLTILKASSCLGTVLGQIINAKRIAKDVGDQIMVCQTDDDASKWTKTRGKEWLESVPDIERLVSSDKYSKTNDLWLFRHKFLIITGPGITAAQSDQVRYVQTDESHLDAYPRGRLVEFEKRMGARWDRQGTHITTAANAGKEVDQFYFQGTQNEWHWRCTKCNELIWPLWEEDAKKIYNGERIFHFSEESEIVFAVCPHCQKTYADTSRERYSLQHDADYVAKNPNAPIEYASYRWSAQAAAHWMPWREFRLEWYAALESAKLGDLKPHEDFQKKRLCNSYTPSLPDFGDSHGESNYKLGDVWGKENTVRILTADYQAGKKGEGSHLWALVTEWTKQGDSRRISYRRLATWGQLRAMQLEFGIPDRLLRDNRKGIAGRDARVYVDCGYDNRTVFYQCSLYSWYAVRGDATPELYHTVATERGNVQILMPYSQPERQNGNVGGATPDKLHAVLRGPLPKGWCLAIVMSNPQMYGYLNSLQSGVAGRYFGVASDMPEKYTEGFPAFIPVTEKDKKTNVSKVYWKLVKPFAHPWDCEVMALVGAIRAGYYPLASTSQKVIDENKELAIIG